MAERIPNLLLRWIREHELNLSRDEFAARLRAASGLQCDRWLVQAWEEGRVKCPRPVYRRALVEVTGHAFRELGFTGSVGVAMESGEPPELEPGTPRHVDPALIPYFREQLAGHYGADMLLGPRDLIGTVTAQFSLIRRLAGAAAEDTRRELLRLACAYGAFVGWMHQDAGDLNQAWQWRDQALEMAHRARDGQLVSYALTNRAMVKTDTGDGPAALDLTAAALEHRDRLAPKLRQLAHVQRAHGMSVVGDRAGVDDQLDQAATLTDRIDDDWPWGNAARRTPGYLEIQRATCYGRLGLPEEALTLWRQVEEGVPATSKRDGGVWLARQANAHADLSAPEEAVTLARRAVVIAEDTGSMRLRNELTALQKRMRRWRRHSAGRELDALLAGLS